jgi:hypothetical protein
MHVPLRETRTICEIKMLRIKSGKATKHRVSERKMERQSELRFNTDAVVLVSEIKISGRAESLVKVNFNRAIWDMALRRQACCRWVALRPSRLSMRPTDYGGRHVFRN